MTNVDFSWNPVAGAIGYNWRITDLFSGTVVDSGTVTPPAALTVNVSGLYNSTLYEFGVKAICDEDGLESSESIITEKSPDSLDKTFLDTYISGWISSEIQPKVVLVDQSQPTPYIVSQTVPTTTNSYPITPVWESSVQTFISLDSMYIINNQIFTLIENIEGPSSTSYLNVRVEVNGNYYDDIVITNFDSLDVIALDFSTINLNLYRMIENGDNLRLKFIWVTPTYRGVTTTQTIYNLFGISYPTS